MDTIWKVILAIPVILLGLFLTNIFIVTPLASVSGYYLFIKGISFALVCGYTYNQETEGKLEQTSFFSVLIIIILSNCNFF